MSQAYADPGHQVSGTTPPPDPLPDAGASILAHLRLDRLQLLGAADRHVVLMLLETSNQFATTRLHARTYLLREMRMAECD